MQRWNMQASLSPGQLSTDNLTAYDPVWAMF